MIIITIPPSGFWLGLGWIWVHDNSSSFPLDSGACPSPPPPGPRSPPPPPPWCWSLASSQSWRRSHPPATTHWCQKTKMAGTENIGHYYIYLRQYSLSPLLMLAIRNIPLLEKINITKSYQVIIRPHQTHSTIQKVLWNCFNNFNKAQL